MASERLKIDADNHWVSGGVTDDDALDIVMLRIDPSTKRLKVNIQALDKDTDGVQIWANTVKDGTGTGYIPLVDADGHLQVDVLSGGGGGSPSGYVDGIVIDPAQVGIPAMGTDGSNLQFLSVDANGQLKILPYGSQGVVLQQKITSNDLIVTLDGETVAVTNADGDGLLVNLGANNDITLPGTSGSGSFTTVEDEVKLTLNGEANVSWQITGTWAGVISFEASNDNSNWVAIWGYQAGTTTIVQATTVNGIFRCTTAGFRYVRARYSTDTSGTAVVTGIASHGTSGVFQNFPAYGAQQLGKQEDVASATGDTGTGIMAIQTATPANKADAEGDYEFLQMSAGRLWVSAVVTSLPAVTAANLDIRDLDYTQDDVGVYGSQNVILQQKVTSNDLIVTLDGESVAVTNAGTFVVQENGAALTALQLIDNFISGSRGLVTEDNSAAIKTSVELIDDAIVADDAAFTPATTKVMMAGHFADDASPDSVHEGDAGASRMSLDRILYVEPPFGTGTTGTTDCTNVSTAYRITASSTRVHNFRLQAKSTNSGTITWGWSSTYASNYMELRPGASVMLNDINISLLYFGSTFAGDDIVYSYTI